MTRGLICIILGLNSLCLVEKNRDCVSWRPDPSTNSIGRMPPFMVGPVHQIFPGQSSVWFTVFFWFLVILGYSCFDGFPNRIDSIASVGLGINLLETGKNAVNYLEVGKMTLIYQKCLEFFRIGNSWLLLFQ